MHYGDFIHLCFLGLIERILNKPEAYKRIPSGETSATGQSIVEFEDIDGTRYHGFMSDAGNLFLLPGLIILATDCP